MTTLDNIDHLC